MQVTRMDKRLAIKKWDLIKSVPYNLTATNALMVALQQRC